MSPLPPEKPLVDFAYLSTSNADSEACESFPAYQNSSKSAAGVSDVQKFLAAEVVYASPLTRAVQVRAVHPDLRIPWNLKMKKLGIFISSNHPGVEFQQGVVRSMAYFLEIFKEESQNDTKWNIAPSSNRELEQDQIERESPSCSWIG